METELDKNFGEAYSSLCNFTKAFTKIKTEIPGDTLKLCKFFYVEPVDEMVEEIYSILCHLRMSLAEDDINERDTGQKHD